ncbi:MAG: nuclear transport factor 2 family protein [Myxococcales bacterium]|nr:nuclear transport factor 2 family protein [Myxococcales bacterium]
MTTAENKAIVRVYFDKMTSGAVDLPDLLADDVTWWVPPSSKLGGTHEGKAAVLELMGSGVDLYDADTPLDVEIEQMVAEDDWVTVQTTITGKTARGEDYRNHYHFAFQLRDGKIVLVKEYVDTLYAEQKLFG